MLTAENHRKIHQELHGHLDSLVADFIVETHKLPSKTTILELIDWSHDQTLNAKAIDTDD
jgi:hypothetical protein